MSFVHRGNKPAKAPSIGAGDVEEYGIDWTNELDAGETIVGSVWTIKGDLVRGVENASTTQTSIFISGAVLGKVYLLSNKVTMTDGREVTKSMYVRCCPT